jgi:dolichol-phosphate mannosyltransferase
MYNEEAVAEKCVRTVCKALDAIPYSSSLIIVNDGSDDKTGSILARLKPEYNRLIVLTHEQNKGYGSALKTGARHASEIGFDYLLFMDSDLTNDPKYLPLFVEKMLEGFDVIKASRYIQGGGVLDVPIWKVIISIIGNRVANILYGLPVRDCTNGFRAIKTCLVKQMQLREKGFAIIMEELYYAKYLAKSFCEIPYTLKSRKKGQRKSSLSYGPTMLYCYIKYAVKAFLNQSP